MNGGSLPRASVYHCAREPAALAHPPRGFDRERVGRSVPGVARSRGDRGRPELRAHGCHPIETVKTDKRDARTLCEACRLGAYRPAHRLCDTQRHVRAELAVRNALVRTLTRYIALVKSFVRRHGLRVPSGEAEYVPDTRA
ncbi:MAG: hypothetical protein ABR543_11095 [Gemmatimonadaceae bacterium]